MSGKELKKKPKFGGCLLILFGAVVLVVAWGWRFVTGRVLLPQSGRLIDELARLPDHSLVEIEIRGQGLIVEVVNTMASITQGLSDREEIGSEGMLFVLPKKVYTSFWMPRMHFDLDILWFDNERLVQISANVPAPEAETATWKLPKYPSEQAVNLVLEISAGRAAALSLQKGDSLQLKRVVSE
jgi:uncharacterized membrane protein (UPF0127 family)